MLSIIYRRMSLRLKECLEIKARGLLQACIFISKKIKILYANVCRVQHLV